ncbi:MAG: hypothetical protein JW854_12720 [Actinobacteria bacterium]|nr:hypothetical protein [Actinomycetota bacterium]
MDENSRLQRESSPDRRAEGPDGQSGSAWPGIRRAIRLIAALAVIALLVLFLFLNLAPFGAELDYDILMEVEDKEANELNSYYLLGSYDYGRRFVIDGTRMASDQIVFSLKVPYQHFDRAEIAVEYRGDPEELLFGITSGSSPWLDIEPVHNRSLNALEWKATQEDDLILFQKEPGFSSVGQFLAETTASIEQGTSWISPPDLSTYYYDRLPLYRGTGQVGENGTYVPLSLRGTHAAYVYVAEGYLDLEFTKHDLNIYNDEDAIAVKVFDENECIFQHQVEDDGDPTASDQASPPQEVDLTLDGLGDGFYRIVWECGMDVLFKDIHVSSRHFSFMDSVFMVQDQLYGLGVSGPVSLYTAAGILAAETWHPESMQDLIVDGEPLVSVDKVAEPFTEDLPPGIKEITISNPDLLLNAPGSSFGVSEESLLIPSSVPYSQALPLEDIRYILADYALPDYRDGGYVRELFFDLRGLEVGGNTLQLLLTAPGLVSRGEEVDIISIEVRLVKE